MKHLVSIRLKHEHIVWFRTHEVHKINCDDLQNDERNSWNISEYTDTRYTQCKMLSTLNKIDIECKRATNNKQSEKK